MNRVESDEPIRVMLADDHELFAEGIRRLLEPRFTVEKVVRSGPELLEAAKRERPDLILCDISMPGMDGIETASLLREAVPAAAVIILTMHEDIAYCRAAFDAGARGYVLKSSAPRELLEAIHHVLEGRVYATPAIAGQLLGATASPKRDIQALLSPRELEISELVAQGRETREIAEELGIAEVTVRTHYSRILRKLGLRNRIELARLVLQGGP